MKKMALQLENLPQTVTGSMVATTEQASNAIWRYDTPAAVHLDTVFNGGQWSRIDPTIRYFSDTQETLGGMAKTMQTPKGPVTILVQGGLRKQHRKHRCYPIQARLWGPGHDWAQPRLAGMLGLHDSGFRFEHPQLHRLQQEQGAGLKLSYGFSVLAPLIHIILEQRVTTQEAAQSFADLVHRFGSSAPGPFGLKLFPPLSILRSLSVADWRAMNVDRQRATTIQRVCMIAKHLEDASEKREDGPLEKIAGIGPWSLGLYRGRVLGDPDAVPLADLHLPNDVAWFFRQERRGTDATMLEDLAPFMGQRWRVLRLLITSGYHAPRTQPRTPTRAAYKQHRRIHMQRH